MKNYLRLLFFTFVFVAYCRVSFCQDITSLEGNYEIDEVNIIFKSGSTFQESTIKGLLASRSGDVFDMTTYLLDVERIKKYYFDNGFFDADVDTSLLTKIDDKEVIENFIVTENSRYVFYKIDYTGLDSIDASVKSRIQDTRFSLIREGKFYSKDTVKLESGRIMDILFNNGYADAVAGTPEILKYQTNIKSLYNKVNVKINFTPNLKYKIGTTTVRFKNKRYNLTEEDIRRELTFNKGEVYDKSKIVESEINLSKFSILENPRIVIDTIDKETRIIDLSVNAVVGNKYDITPELFGYYFQNLFYIGSGISFINKNLWGGGRVLTTSLKFYFNSIKNNRLELVNTIYQPFLFGKKNITGNWNIGYEYRLEDNVNQTKFKNSFGITFALPKYTYINSFQTRWDIENSRIVLQQDLLLNDTGNTVLPKFDYNEFISKLVFTAVHSSVNNLVFPSGGNYQSYELEESGLFSGVIRKLFNTASYSYVKFTNLNSLYWNLSSREVNVPSALAYKFLSGIIIEYGENSFTFLGEQYSNDRVPRDTRYFCGGSSSVRGWGAKQLGIVPNKELGGNFLFENTFEYRIKPFLEVSNVYLRDLGFATFVDYGNVWSEVGKFKLNEIAVAAGAGIRYYTIIGAIRFDIGLKVYDPQPGPVGGSNWLFGKGCNFNDKYNFQFGIGNTF
ncbi:MAG: BamA/TamA family outer membrane protein [Bacteroidetes bacterium]|nr:BamA/TamA family outer membrane protein [Bacteroidota bacterium]